MADSLAVDIKASLAWLLTETLQLSTVSDNATLQYEQSLTDGTGADEADVLWHDERVVASLANDDLDLTGLPISLFGGSVNVAFVSVKAILIVNTSLNSGELLYVGGAGATAFDGPFNDDGNAVAEVGADSCLLLSNKKDGWAVTPGTGDILRIHNPNAGDVTFRIALVGTSA